MERKLGNGKKKDFLSWLSRPETLIGLCAIIVSVVAVAVSAYEAQIMRQWQRAAVWPYVQLSRTFTSSRAESEALGERAWRLSFNLSNVGVGPAKIQNFSVTVDGEPHESWKSAIQALLGDDSEFSYGQSSVNGVVIPAEQDMEMFQITDPALAARIYNAMEDRLNFTACFCSVFDDCWRTSFLEYGKSTPVESCEPSEIQFLE